MCMRSSSPQPQPVPKEDPSIARREAEQNQTKIANQKEDIAKRKDEVYAMGGKRKLITSSGAGYLGAGQMPTLGA